MLTAGQLSEIMPHLRVSRRDLCLPHLRASMEEFLIGTALRQAAYLAQLAHESAELRYMEEIATGSAYEGRADLGNTRPGDGRRFKGRGPIQLTGRANYARFGSLLGLDLLGNPAIVAAPEVGFRVAGLFWKLNKLNELADAETFDRITRRINGGLNGAAGRAACTTIEPSERLSKRRRTPRRSFTWW
jgi:putative chitinase